MRKVVFDIETKNAIWDADPTKLDLALVCTWDSETNGYETFFESDLPKLWQLLEKTDMLIGYNSDHFDIPLLNRYYPGDLTRIKSLDLLREIKNASGKRFKLDSVAQATIGQKKSADGLQAVDWWQKGEFEKVRDYCLDDVRITKEVYEYAHANGKIKYLDWGGEVREVKLDTSHWDKKEPISLTHTLPF